MALTKGEPTQADAPTGGSGDTAAKKTSARSGQFDISIFETWCKQCGLCVAFCPKKVLTEGLLGNPQVTNPEDCIGCLLCVLHCPDFAISVCGKEKNEEEEV